MQGNSSVLDFSAFPDTCFIYYPERVLRDVKSFRSALNCYFPKATLAYSVKTNSHPAVLNTILDSGIMAEAVSEAEYSECKRIGFMGDHIIYNGPIKSKESFLRAVEGGSIVNIDSLTELSYLDSITSGNKARLGVRLNVNLQDVCPEEATFEEASSRFGFRVNEEPFKEVTEAFRAHPRLKLSGVHIHRTTRNRSVRFYAALARWVGKVISEYNLKPEYIDFGGGFSAPYPSAPTFNHYAGAMARELRLCGVNLTDTEIIVEPGTAVVARAFDYLVTVTDVRATSEGTIIITTGTRNHIDPLFKQNSISHELLRFNNSTDKQVPVQKVEGCTCMEFDCLLTLRNAPALQPGDKIIFHNVGAYTLSLAPEFIVTLPEVVTINKNDIHG
ncbi:MAG: diaminopimelate decarboxylase [Muribaculaceae bacterium]|nr:diaminopimelate decarboxylase [Muribaculaceae bacterium]